MPKCPRTIVTLRGIVFVDMPIQQVILIIGNNYNITKSHSISDLASEILWLKISISC